MLLVNTKKRQNGAGPDLIKKCQNCEKVLIENKIVFEGVRVGYLAGAMGWRLQQDVPVVQVQQLQQQDAVDDRCRRPRQWLA